jgi:hypothetical protein
MMANSPFPDLRANEQGFVLVSALLFLVILTLVGISMINTSVTEIQIAGNDKLRKQAFSLADGGTEAGSNLLEENIACPTGFTGAIPLRIGNSEILTANFWILENAPPDPYPSDPEVPVNPLYPNGKRHIRMPNNDALPHTNLNFFGNSSLSTGSAIQMIAGYEGTGYSAATGGAQLVTNVDSQRIGENNSGSSLRARWRHIIGHEGACKY